MADDSNLAMIGRMVLETREAVRRIEARLDGMAAELGVGQGRADGGGRHGPAVGSSGSRR